MFAWLDTAPVWLVALVIFGLRILDVSIGTVRTITVVQGWVALSVLLGTMEVLIWVTAVSQAILRAGESPLLILAFASGFATGNAVGILVERWLALGGVILRIVSATAAGSLEQLLRTRCSRVMTFPGTEAGRATTLLYAVVRRKEAPAIIRAARELDPGLFFAIDTLRETSVELLEPLPYPTGWRTLFKMK